MPLNEETIQQLLIHFVINSKERLLQFQEYVGRTAVNSIREHIYNLDASFIEEVGDDDDDDDLEIDQDLKIEES